MKPEDFQKLSDPEIHDLHKKVEKQLDDHLYAFALSQLYLGEIEQTSTEQKKPAVRDDVLTQAHLDNQAFSPFIPKDLKSRLVWTQPTPDQKLTSIPLSTEHLITIGRKLESLEGAIVAQEEDFNALGKVKAGREEAEVRRLLGEGYLPEGFKQFFPVPAKEGEGTETEISPVDKKEVKERRPYRNLREMAEHVYAAYLTHAETTGQGEISKSALAHLVGGEDENQVAEYLSLLQQSHFKKYLSAVAQEQGADLTPHVPDEAKRAKREETTFSLTLPPSPLGEAPPEPEDVKKNSPQA